MRRLAVLAALLLLSACATAPQAPCAPADRPAACPVYKAPDDARVPCTPAPACAPAGPVEVAVPPVPSGFQPWAEGFAGDLDFVIGDQIQIDLPFYEDEDATVTVAPDGNIYIGLIGGVPAAGRSPAELEAELEARYAKFLRFPEVGVVPAAFTSRQVYVGGEVASPGAYPLTGPTGVLEAVFQAGGFRTSAHLENVVLIRRGPNDLPMLRYMNLRVFANDGTPTENTLLRPFDIIWVPRSPIAKLNLFIEQYIEGVVPFNHNFSYAIVDFPGTD